MKLNEIIFACVAQWVGLVGVNRRSPLPWEEPILFVANQPPANVWYFVSAAVIGAWNCKQPAENYYTRTCTGQLEIGLKDKM